jgi:molybdate transport system ATP-binding protein
MLSVAITKRVGDFLLDVRWEAAEPVAALVGPSGSGKTLTLHCLAGLVRPDRGRIQVGERVLFDAGAGIDEAARARRLGYVFQGYALFPYLTVRDNIAYGLKAWPRPARAARAALVIERLGLAGLEARYPAELSGGQQQRVALGRALAPDPDLLLLDEPLSALDAPLRRQLRDELEGTLREWGKATVLVTHDLAEAYQLADRIIVYEHGRVLQAAPRSALLWQPASATVARIMGMRNILQGVVEKASAERIRLRWRGQALEAANSPSHAYRPEPGTPAAFFIRPEHVRLIRKDRGALDPSRHMNLMRGVVVGEADLGTARVLRVRLDAPGPPAQGDFDLEVEIPPLVHEILDLGRDRQWQLSVHRGAIHVLPA